MNDLINACNDALLDIESGSSGVKRRQIYDDIKFMQDSCGYNAPIEVFKDGRYAYYRYSNINFSINSQPLNEKESLQLKEALITLGRFKGLPQFEWIDEMNARLEDTLKSNSENKIIGFDENQYLKGVEYISSIYNAITNKQVLNIKYRSFKQSVDLNFEINPYYLKQYNNRWFLFGLNEELNQITNLALDRIEHIEITKKPYRLNRINFDEYFEDIVGVSIPINPEVVKLTLKIANNLVPYITSKPIHGSQKLKIKSEFFSIIELELILNYEIEALLRSYGSEVEVIEPEDFRNKMSDEILKLKEIYNL
jgi:predicted DNA-binding transcriptional regulator YafY